MKNIPNLLSLLRLLLALILFLFEPFTAIFMTLYFVACITDAFDGLLARKLNAQSKLGANLDALADHVLVVSVFANVAPVVGVGMWALWLVLGILLFKVVIVIFTVRKYGKAVMSHSYGHKVGAATCFLFPIFTLFFNGDAVVATLGAFMCLVMVEELFIAVKLPEPNPDFKGFLFEKVGDE